MGEEDGGRVIALLLQTEAVVPESFRISRLLGYFFPEVQLITFWVNVVILVIGTISVSTVILAWLRLRSEKAALDKLQKDSRSITDPTELGSLAKYLPDGTLARRRLEDLVTLKKAGDSPQPGFLIDMSAAELENEAAFARWASGGVVLLGLGGTVWGLAVSVQRGQALLGNTDAESYSEAISQVLGTFSGLDVAFATTLAGIMAAISIGLLVSLLRREQNHYIGDLEHLLHTRLAPRFQTSVSHSMAEAANKLSQIQEKLDGSLNDIVDKLDTHGHALANMVNVSFSALTKTFCKKTGELNTVIAESMRDLFQQQEQIAVTLHGLLGDLPDDSLSLAEGVARLRGVVGDLKNAVETNKTLIPALQEALAKGIDQQTIDLHDSMNAYTGLLAKSADRHDENVADGLGKVKGTLGELLKNYTAALDKSWAEGSRIQAEKIGEQLGRHAIQISGLIKQQSGIAKDLTAAVEAMQKAAGGLSSTTSDGQSAVDRHSEITKELIEVLRNAGPSVSEPTTPSSPPDGEGPTPIAEGPKQRQGLFNKWFGRG